MIDNFLAQSLLAEVEIRSCTEKYSSVDDDAWSAEMDKRPKDTFTRSPPLLGQQTGTLHDIESIPATCPGMISHGCWQTWLWLLLHTRYSQHHLHDKLNSHKLVSVCTSISSYITLARKVPFLYSHATLMLATLKTPKPTLHRIQTPTCQWPIVPQNQLPSTIQMTQDRPIPQNQWPSTT